MYFYIEKMAEIENIEAYIKNCMKPFTKNIKRILYKNKKDLSQQEIRLLDCLDQNLLSLPNSIFTFYPKFEELTNYINNSYKLVLPKPDEVVVQPALYTFLERTHLVHAVYINSSSSDTIEINTNITWNNNCSLCILTNGNIIIHGGNKIREAYIIDPKEKLLTEIQTDISKENHTILQLDNHVYFVGGSSTKFFRFNLNKNSCKKLSDHPYKFGNTSAIRINNYMLITGFNVKQIYSYSPLTDKYQVKDNNRFDKIPKLLLQHYDTLYLLCGENIYDVTSGLKIIKKIAFFEWWSNSSSVSYKDCIYFILNVSNNKKIYRFNTSTKELAEFNHLSAIRI